MGGVFISYRGGDGALIAGFLHRDLADAFGDHEVFYASRRIAPGSFFDDEILAALRTCDVLLAVIGPRWLTAADTHGGRRLDDPRDWVRREIAVALTGGLRVIPVLVEDAPMPAADELPDDIRDLTRCTYMRLGHRHGEADTATVVAVLRETVPRLAALRPPTSRTDAERASPPVPRQLPADVAGFSGRRAALDALDTFLPEQGGDREQVAVITAIAGTAGVGKTALAVHFGHRRADRFPNGQLYVNLRGYDRGPPMPPGEALERFLHALGVAPGRVPADLDERAGLYRSLMAGRRMLVVLDNARSPEQVRPLLPGAVGPLVVVTSRDDLRGLIAHDDARSIALDVLSAPEAVDLLGRVLGHERVRAEPDATAQLADLCARLPLALRITAAHLATRPHEAIADLVLELRDEDRLARLDAGDDHDAAVGAALDLSYHTLDDGSRCLFRRLGLVPGPDVTPDAAAALVAASRTEALRLLDRLASAHLVEPYAPGRFRFHDLLRLYARRRAGSDETASERSSAVRRLYEFYSRSTDTAGRMLAADWKVLPRPEPGPAVRPRPIENHGDATGWFESEAANIGAAITQAVSHGVPEFAVHLVNALQARADSGVIGLDLVAAAGAGLEAARTVADPRYEATMHAVLATVFLHKGRFARAIDHGNRALAFFRRIDDLENECNSRISLGIAHTCLVQFEQAREHYLRVLTSTRAAGLRGRQGSALSNLGWLHIDMGRLAEAERYLDEALAAFEETRNLVGQSAVHGDLGITLTERGRLDDARRHLATALMLADQTGSSRRRAIVHGAIAEIHRRGNEHRQALQHAERAVNAANECGYVPTIADAVLRLAQVRLSQGRWRIALARVNEARSMIRASDFRLREAHAARVLAEVYLAAGEYEEAAAHARYGARVAESRGERMVCARASYVLGLALRHLDDPQATLAWQAALAMFTEAGSPDAELARALLHGG